MTPDGSVVLNPAFRAAYAHSPLEFSRNLLGFHPDARQRRVLEALEGNGILCCHRQFGKSTTVAAKAVHRAAVCPGSQIVLCAPTMRQTNELFRKIRAFASNIGVARKSDGFNALSLVFPNQSRVVAVPADGDKVRGFSSVSMIVVDEAARVPDEAYHGLTPMLARSSGVVWLMSTPKGRTGFFHDIWHANSPDWTRVFATVDDCTAISKEFLDKERRSKPDSEFQQDYYCVFQDAGSSYFSVDEIDRAFRTDVTELFRPNPHVRGTIQVSYFIGLDLGQQRDYTAIAVLEFHRFNTGVLDAVTAQWKIEATLRLRWLERVPLRTAYPEVVNRLRNLTDQYPLKGETCLVVDATGPGAPVVDLIRAARLGATLVPVSITGGESANYSNGVHHVPKRELISVLQIYLQNRTIEIAADLDLAARLREELIGMRPSVHHGDLAMALSLAAWQARRRWPK